MNNKISVIVTAYNGEHYLSEQIDSILKQNYQEWQLIIRDDGSSDTTSELIREYAHRYPDKIRILSDQLGHIGVSESFLQLLNASDTDYVMFCDQDDLWQADKIKAVFNKMKELEARYGVSTPGLVHTDLQVVDEKLNNIAPSFWRYQHLNPRNCNKLNKLLVQNVVTGCTVMINRALKDKIKFLPDKAIVYDWWISLAGAAFGKIVYVSKPTLLYRQHGDNSIGAKEWNLKYIKNMALSGRRSLSEILLKTQLQAAAFLEVYKNELSANDVNLLTVYSTLSHQGWFARRVNLIKYGFFKTGFLRNIGLFLAI